MPGKPVEHGSIWVTGGAGYICSHVVLQLRARGERVVVLDDLSRGFRRAVLDAPLGSVRLIDMRPFGVIELGSNGRRWALRVGSL